MRKELVLAAVVALVAQFGAVPVQAANGGGNNNGGFVSGHTEGMPDINGNLCVTYNVGANPHTECKGFSSGGPNDTAISIPESGLATARLTVTVGDGSPGPFWPTYDQLSGAPCTNMPLSGPAGMALCQSTNPVFADQVHRFNTYWNTNSAGNGTPGKVVCDPRAGTNCDGSGTPH